MFSMYTRYTWSLTFTTSALDKPNYSQFPKGYIVPGSCTLYPPMTLSVSTPETASCRILQEASLSWVCTNLCRFLPIFFFTKVMWDPRECCEPKITMKPTLSNRSLFNKNNDDLKNNNVYAYRKYSRYSKEYRGDQNSTKITPPEKTTIIILLNVLWLL